MTDTPITLTASNLRGPAGDELRAVAAGADFRFNDLLMSGREGNPFIMLSDRIRAHGLQVGPDGLNYVGGEYIPPQRAVFLRHPSTTVWACQ